MKLVYEFEEEYEFEVDDDRVFEVIAKQICLEKRIEPTKENVEIVQKTLRQLCQDSLIDLDYALLDAYENILYDAFESEAYTEFKDCMAYRNDPLGYNGLSESDFM